jgi:hypothetical protein
MKRRLLIALSLLGLVLGLPLVAFGDVGVGPGGGTPGTSLNFQLVGHNDLSGFELDGNTVPRGMNSQVTIYGHYAYIGNRTDGSSTCGIGDPRRGVQPCPHPHPGILIADIADPTNPTVVGEIGPPNAGQVGITTRELRVWPQKKLLMVMTFRCSSVIHACPVGNDTTFPFDIKFFDLTDPVHPAFISSYVPTSVAGQHVKPHEMFLWVDPKNPDRALLWLSTPSVSVNPARPNLMIVDISDVPSGGAVHDVAEGNWNQFFPGAADPNNYDFDLSLHSMTPCSTGRAPTSPTCAVASACSTRARWPTTREAVPHFSISSRGLGFLFAVSTAAPTAPTNMRDWRAGLPRPRVKKETSPRAGRRVGRVAALPTTRPRVRASARRPL